MTLTVVLLSLQLLATVDISLSETEIICRVPSIANGLVPGPAREYRENELLNFVCKAGFIPESGVASKCTKVGQMAEWSPTPACEQIRCRLELPALPGTTYDPASKSLFLPDDVVTVTCGASYWIQNTRTTSAEATCQPDGQWTVRPVCQEVICSNIRQAGVYFWDFRYWEQKKLGAKVRFTCRNDYTPTDGATRATCTRDGWTPSPLCGEITCKRKDFEFATIRPFSENKDVYRSRERVDYVCRNNYQETFSLYCGPNGWIGEPQCPSSNCQHRVVEHAQISQNRKATYWHGEKVEYTCSYNATQRFNITCDYGVWRGITNCTAPVHCGTPPPLDDGDIRESMKPVYQHNEQVEYVCQNLYTMKGGPRRTCINGEWSGEVTCLKPCTVDRDAMNRNNITLRYIQDEKVYSAHEDQIEFVCKSGQPVGGVTMRRMCVNGEMSLPSCI